MSLFKKASETTMKGILGYTEEPLVSIDYRGMDDSCMLDSSLTLVMDGNMVDEMMLDTMQFFL